MNGSLAKFIIVPNHAMDGRLPGMLSRAPKLKVSELAVVLVFFAGAVAVLCLAASAGISDTFVYSNTALAQTAVNDGHLDIAPYANVGNSVQRHANGQSERYITTAAIAELSMVSGISPGDLAFVPVCGVMLFFVAYAFAKYLLNNVLAAGAIAFCVTIEPVVFSLGYSVYLQGWAFVLLFGFMLAFLKAMEANQALASRLKMLGVCIAIIIAISFTYYSAMAYALGFAGVVILLRLVSGGARERLDNRLQLVISAFVAVSLAAFIVFDPHARGFLEGLGEKLTVATDLAGDYLSRLVGGESQSGTTVSGGAIPEGSKMYIGVALYALLLAPVAALILVSAVRGGWKKKLSSVRNQAFVALLSVIALDVLVYMMVGTMSFKMVLLLAPFAGAYAASKLKYDFKPHFALNVEPKKTLSVFVILLLVIVPLKAGAYIGTAGDNRMEPSVQSSEWLMSLEISNVTTLSDMTAAEKLFMYQTSLGISDGESIVFNMYTLPFFYKYNESLANRTLTEHSVEYLVITWSTVNEGLAGTDWLAGKAFGDVEVAFGRYSFLDLVYADGYCLIYRFQSGFGVDP
jgi:hypothetical protein